MSKMSIEWHKTCLENMRRTAMEKKENAKRAADDAERIERDCIAYDGQIIEAELRGVDGFDRERFGKKRAA